MEWVVEIGDEFEPEFDELDEDVRTEEVLQEVDRQGRRTI